MFKPCDSTLGGSLGFRSNLLSTSSDKIFIGVEIVVATIISSNVFNFDLVAKESADATEALNELEAVGTFVGDELDVDTVLFVVDADPVSQLLASNDFAILASFLIFEVFRILLLNSIEQMNFSFTSHRILDLVPHHFDVFEKEHALERTQL